MKKLMIAAAIVCAAAFAQAASYNWAADTSLILPWGAAEAEDLETPVADGLAAYIVFVSEYAQADLVADFASEDGIKQSKLYADSVNYTDGGAFFLSGDFEAAFTTDQVAYFVFTDGDKLFVSDVADAEYNALSPSPISFEDQYDFSMNNYDVAGGYQGAGWYGAAVPEPTTGLLMLIGMAGLALRRRRA